MVRPRPTRCRLIRLIEGREGDVTEHKQDLVEKSRYHVQLERLPFVPPYSTRVDPFVVDESTVRYWSDYSQVALHPRSIQRLPDLFDWESGMGDWVAGKETFDRYNNQVNIPGGCGGYELINWS